jgi:hypothetical protein
MTQAYPLHWPPGMGRTASRTSSRFNTSVGAAANNVLDELRRFGNDSGKRVESIVVSSNVTLTEHRPRDPGVAAYFRWDGIDCCIAVDRYNKPEENLQAIAKVIEAERTKLRHGGLNIVRASFRGYAHLPPPKGPDGQLAKPWWMELGFSETPALHEAESRYRELVKEHHPDRGGDAAKFNSITDAVRAARLELAKPH